MEATFKSNILLGNTGYYIEICTLKFRKTEATFNQVKYWLVVIYTLKVRETEPIFLMKYFFCYYWLLHWDLQIYGQENGSHFLMTHTSSYYWLLHCDLHI